LTLGCKIIEIDGKDFLESSITDPNNDAVKTVTRKLLDMEDEKVCEYFISKGWIPPKKEVVKPREFQVNDVVTVKSIESTEHGLIIGINRTIAYVQFTDGDISDYPLKDLTLITPAPEEIVFKGVQWVYTKQAGISYITPTSFGGQDVNRCIEEATIDGERYTMKLTKETP